MLPWLTVRRSSLVNPKPRTVQAKPDACRACAGAAASCSCRSRGGDAIEAAREIALRAHFVEPGRRALKQKLHISRRIEGIRLGGGGGDETYAAVVESVDQVDEPARDVAPRRSEHRNGIDQPGMKGLGDMQTVVCYQRLLAQLAEREARHAHGSERHAHLAALDLELDRHARMLAGELAPKPVHLALGTLIRGRELELSARQLLEP